MNKSPSMAWREGCSQLRICLVLTEHLGPVPKTHMEGHSPLELHSRLFGDLFWALRAPAPYVVHINSHGLTYTHAFFIKCLPIFLRVPPATWGNCTPRCLKRKKIGTQPLGWVSRGPHKGTQPPPETQKQRTLKESLENTEIKVKAIFICPKVPDWKSQEDSQNWPCWDHQEYVKIFQRITKLKEDQKSQGKDGRSWMVLEETQE